MLESRDYVAMLGRSSRMPVASECSAFGTMTKRFGSGIWSHHLTREVCNRGPAVSCVEARELCLDLQLCLEGVVLAT